MRVSVKVLSVSDAAEKLDLSTDRVRVLIREGRLPAQRVGREYAILEPDLRWFASLDRSPGRPPSE